MNKPITLEEMKAYVDATWKKCQAEAWRERKPLSDDEIGKAAIAAGCDPNKDDGALIISLARAIEAAHGIGNKK